MPVMPGVLIIEAMAQTSAVLVVETLDLIDKDLLVYFMSIDPAKFRRVVQPGDTLELHVAVQRGRGKIRKFRGEARVGETRSRGGGIYSRLILGFPLNDWTGGFNAWKAETLKKIHLPTVKSNGYSFQIELKYKALNAAVEVSSLPFFLKTVASVIAKCLRESCWKPCTGCGF